jgi:transcriptional regulator with XRE-family HTH domain
MTDFGDELRRLLEERGISLSAAARQAGCSKGYLSNVTHGRKPLTPRVAAGLDRALGTGGKFAAYALNPSPGSATGPGHAALQHASEPASSVPRPRTAPSVKRPPASQLAAAGAPSAGKISASSTMPKAPDLSPLAAVLMSASPGENGDVSGDLAAPALHVWRLRQTARYADLAGDLPRLLAKALVSTMPREEDRERAWVTALTHIYNAASSLAKALGSLELAGIAADRAVRLAGAHGEDPLVGGAAAYRLANVMLSAGQLNLAGVIAINAADKLRPVMARGRSHTAMWGALLATAAQAAARRLAQADAWELLGASKVAADMLATDQADMFSIFGPVSWLMHAVNVAADLGDGAEAIRRAAFVPAESLPSFLAERRIFLLLGWARGHALCGDVASASRTLLDAEQAVPEEIRHNPDARSLVSTLLTATVVRNEPLRALAARMGNADDGPVMVGGRR